MFYPGKYPKWASWTNLTAFSILAKKKERKKERKIFAVEPYYIEKTTRKRCRP